MVTQESSNNNLPSKQMIASEKMPLSTFTNNYNMWKSFLCCLHLTVIHTCDSTSDVLMEKGKTLVTLQCDQSHLCLIFLHPRSCLSLSRSLSYTQMHINRRSSFRQWIASKLRCTHGRAGTWKTKANMQAHIWMKHITGFIHLSISCSEKANVEWNSIMCTP